MARDPSRSFFAPLWYEEFPCKSSSCRAPCCKRWHIALSINEYSWLWGMEISEELHRRIEGSFSLPEITSEERYRLFSPNWFGNCPMFDADGLCLLKKEACDEALPAECRLFPGACTGRTGSISPP